MQSHSPPFPVKQYSFFNTGRPESEGTQLGRLHSLHSEKFRVGNKVLTATPAFDSYWFLAYERQEIFFRRLRGESSPWTNDPILRRHKFTNAYRAADRTSQYLIRNVIYRDDCSNSAQEVVFRVLLFKIFNKAQTWECLERSNGGVLTWEDYSFKHYDHVLEQQLGMGSKIYSAAYMMPPGSRQFGHARKHQNHLRLLEQIMKSELPQRVADATRMDMVFALLREQPTIGDFLAYQYATDINYSDVTDFPETEFVVAGPGARDGIEKCFTDCAGLDFATIIRAVMEEQEAEFDRRNLPFRSLWGRSLQLIDCQNLFCEVSKYARVRHPTIIGSSGRTRIKQVFSPSLRPLTYFFPPKWDLTIPTEQASYGLDYLPSTRRSD